MRIEWVAAQAVRWSGIPKDACSSPVGAASLAICSPHLHRSIRGAQGVLSLRMGAAISQLDLLSLTLLFVSGCGRLQLGVPLGYCSRLLQVVDN